MSKFIDKDRVLEYIIFGVVGKDITCGELTRAIESISTIDIVRCGECKHHKPSKIWAEIKPCIVEPFPSIRCKMLNREVDADDFCSYGERK